uniref:GxxExxY protein n=1 Tax=Hassallia byssoidea TaxID=482630 RepID=UPI001F28DF78
NKEPHPAFEERKRSPPRKRGGVGGGVLGNECKRSIELKAVQNLAPIHESQVMSYLKMTKHPLALLINFNVPILKQGIKRIILF